MAKNSSATTGKPRKIKKAQYKSFSLQKRIGQQGATLPSAFKLMGSALRILRHNWRLFGLIVLIYGVINYVVVQGFSGGLNINEIKGTLSSLFSGKAGSILAGLSLFVYMIGTSGMQTNSTTGAYQFFWIVIISLALIWALRQVYAGKRIRVRDAFYNGMYPFIPFLLVLLVVALQFVPAILGGILYTSVVNGNLAATDIETAIWMVVFAITILITLYMLTSALFALYIVCLKDMTPMKALRSARQLVATRRWLVLRKIVFLPIALFVGGAVCVVPFIIFFAPLALPVFLLVTMAGLAVLHSYLYALYRSLL